MKFDKNSYNIKTVTVGKETLQYRAFENLVYVEHPVNPEFQKMNIYVLECYYAGERVNGYSLHTAPVFMPNMVGGYMPGGIAEPGCSWQSKDIPNTVFRALQQGYVVVSPAIRGRSQQDEQGNYTGKAPACIVDYKAAVRYLRFFSEDLPGDMNKIITNGTSAGGALSSLMGASGNHPDYEPWLKELGAADTADDVFAASCYCPIINLEHADAAYEWQFSDVYNYKRWSKKTGEDGRSVFVTEDAVMPEEQIAIAKQLEKAFPAYVNRLNLADKNRNKLTLDEEGNGSFKEYIKGIVLDSARRAVEQGVDISDKEWIIYIDKKPVDIDFYGWVKDITRMKTAPAFDHLTLDSPENDLFGTETVKVKHFTEFAYQHSVGCDMQNKNCAEDGAEPEIMADEQIIKMLNPMSYVDDKGAKTAAYWRIRHGECDRDTSLAISAILVRKLEMEGCAVDYHSPWGVPHAGDYDLDELFAWIDGICRE